jgi:hypothetical protein
VSGARVAAVGLLTPWGRGVAALPHEARAACEGRPVVAMPRPGVHGERFRRATRECLLGVAAVEALLAEARLPRAALAGDGTALVYTTAGAYGAANRAFIEAAAGALHFPYTAPSAVPAEVAIEFGLRGAYAILLGGATATLDALAHAATLLAAGACERAIVLAVETFDECADLWTRGRCAGDAPLVEAAAAALLVPGDGTLAVVPATGASSREAVARRRAGETLAAAPLVALALGLAGGETHPAVSGRWRGRRARLAWSRA